MHVVQRHSAQVVLDDARDLRMIVRPVRDADLTPARQAELADQLVDLALRVPPFAAGVAGRGTRLSPVHEGLMVTTGLVAFFGMFGSIIPFGGWTLFDLEPIYHAAGVGFGGAVGAMPLVFLVYRGKSNGWVFIKMTAVLLVVCAPVMAAALAWYLNCALDDAPRTVRDLHVQGTTTTNTKSGTHYRVRVSGWRAGQGEALIRVSRGGYDAARRDGRVRLVTRPGYLGAEWFVDAESP